MAQPNTGRIRRSPMGVPRMMRMDSSTPVFAAGEGDAPPAVEAQRKRPPGADEVRLFWHDRLASSAYARLRPAGGGGRAQACRYVVADLFTLAPCQPPMTTVIAVPITFPLGNGAGSLQVTADSARPPVSRR